jgi:hypothetical protein
MCYNSVHAAKETPHVTITKVKWLTLFKEIIAVYSEKQHKHKTKELLNVAVLRVVAP